MDYNLYDIQASLKKGKQSTIAVLKKLSLLIKGEKKNLIVAIVAIIINSGLNLVGPLLIGIAIDKYVQTGQMHGVLVYSGILLVIYLVVLCANYLQTQLMGAIGQRMVYNLRNSVFNKLQALPVGFFNQNKSGDLISRINGDTDKINQFFSQSLMRFLGIIVTMIGAGIFLISINPRLGGASLIPAIFILIFNKSISAWVKRKNAESLKSTGGMSGNVQESLDHFKTIVAFNRRDYFREKFDEANQQNYKKAIGAGLANKLLMPVYTLFTNIAQLIVLAYGIYLISIGDFTVGLLISFLAYANRFYSPLRQLAALWASFQTALAAWDRISVILNLKSNMKRQKGIPGTQSKTLLEFKNVFFSYDGKKNVLNNVNFHLKRGKTYAFIGPTGGGKTTNASLLSRLYDPDRGSVYLDGRDIRTFTDEERSRKIGFILQEPFLFNGTVRENILFGNEKYRGTANNELSKILNESHLDVLLDKFDYGLDTKI
ncbi:MAG TPA: ABC transporter ATP-binding protein, partial [Chitinophagaceae bacterium]|nr:ABC transporter ATP-binding protein [Chitinophagaceae bacterium]